MGECGLKASGGRSLWVRVEMGRGRRRMQQTAAPGAPGEQKPSGREVDTRRAPWVVPVVVVGTAIQVSCGHWGMRDVLVVASFLASRNCEVCVSVFVQT